MNSGEQAVRRDLRFTRAIVRRPSPSFAEGLTTAGLGPPSYSRMLRQHEQYIRALSSSGLEVTVLDPLPQFPDAHFVEDVAVVLPELAVLARPGADSRLGEEAAMEPVLASLRPLERIEPPGTLDGGDVLVLENHCLIGVSDRTNEEGAAQLGRMLDARGWSWTALSVGTGLHLKSDVNSLGGQNLLVTREYADRPGLASYRRVTVPVGEEYAANSLWVNGRLLVPAGFPRTRRKLEESGPEVLTLEVSEAQKMDGGLTCMSLRF
jgi:dimethylargininase